MARLDINFDDIPAQREPQRKERELVPPGRYRARIIESEMIPTKKGDGGEYLQLTWSILGGDFDDKYVWQRLNIVNKSEQAQGIAKRQLKNLMNALNVDELDDSEQLHNQPLDIDVVIEKGTNGYADKNDVKGFYANIPSPAPAPAAPSAPQKESGPGQRSPRPWEQS